MHINFTTSTNIAQALAGLAAAAATLVTSEEDGAIFVGFTPAQLREISHGLTTQVDIQGTVDITAGDETAEAPKEETKTTRFRRTKEENDAGLDVAQSKAFRASGLTLDQWLAKDSADNDTSPPVDLNEKPPETTGEVKTAATLEDQGGMSTPPTGVDPVTLDDIRLVVGKLVGEGKGDAVKVYTEKLGLGRLSEAAPAQYADIVAYLNGLCAKDPDALV